MELNNEEETIATNLSILRPKTPGPRRPLSRMMKDSEKTEINKSNTQRRKQTVKVDDKLSDESDLNDSESDSEINNLFSSHTKTSKLSKSRESSSSKSITPNSKTHKSILTNRSKESNKGNISIVTNKNKKNSNNLIFIVISIVSFISIVYYLLIHFGLITNKQFLTYIHLDKSLLNENDELINNFGVSIDDVSYRFKEQDPNIWDEIYATVVDIIKHPQKRSIIFLFSNHEDPMFCLAKMIGNAIKAVLHVDNNLWLGPDDFGDDYGLVIDKFKKPIKENRIVIVQNLLNIHPEAMRAFHNLCDSEHPLVNQTIYILTMVAEGYKRDEKPISFVEKQLADKMRGKINVDKIQPLLARLTDGVIIPVQPEPAMTDCPLRY